MGFEEFRSLKRSAAMIPLAPGPDFDKQIKFFFCVLVSVLIAIIYLIVYIFSGITIYNILWFGSFTIAIIFVIAYREEIYDVIESLYWSVMSPFMYHDKHPINHNEYYLSVVNIFRLDDRDQEKTILHAVIKYDFTLYTCEGEIINFTLDRKNETVIFEINGFKYQGDTKIRVR